jgi:hypothetical protein
LYPVFYFLAILGVGHFVTNIGRRALKQVAYRYYLFGAVSLGFWLSAAPDAFRLESDLSLYLKTGEGEKIVKFRGMMPKATSYRNLVPMYFWGLKKMRKL